MSHLPASFEAIYQRPPTVVASAPGRIEVLGNHTDYNAGLTLSCAVGFRCDAAMAPLDEPVALLASTAFDTPPERFPLTAPLAFAPRGHWANYLLGLATALQERGHTVPGFALLVDSAVPRSAGVSSSAALEMAVLTGLVSMMQLDLPPIELARIGQWAESRAVGAQTGMLDQLSSLCGQRDHLLLTDFASGATDTAPLPPGWVFVAVDSGVKHDLTVEYNDRRRSCEAAAEAMGVATLREASLEQLDKHRPAMPAEAYGCAKHILGENQRVRDAIDALGRGDVERVGRLMFESHDSSRHHFRNSCPELDRIVEYAAQDARCVGARLSGGGFGGITIHLVRGTDAERYRGDLLSHLTPADSPPPWSAVCAIDDGAKLVT